MSHCSCQERLQFLGAAFTPGAGSGRVGRGGDRAFASAQRSPAETGHWSRGGEEFEGQARPEGRGSMLGLQGAVSPVPPVILFVPRDSATGVGFHHLFVPDVDGGILNNRAACPGCGSGGDVATGDRAAGGAPEEDASPGDALGTRVCLPGEAAPNCSSLLRPPVAFLLTN